MNAFVFPGQGSQYVGMTRKIPECEIKTDFFRKAGEILEYELMEICENGPQEKLTSTDITQPALFTVSAVFDSLLKEKGITPSIVAGHSLGEYSALYSAGVISFEDGLKLTSLRGRLMKQANTLKPGKMLAVVGMEREKVEELLEKSRIKGTIVLANHNAQDQFVLSGEISAIAEAESLVKTLGARLVRPLEVSAAFHSPLMEPVVKEMSEAIDSSSFSKPKIPVVQNVSARPETETEVIKQNLKAQLTSGVRWFDSVISMRDMGVIEFYEVGPKNVLKGLISRIIQGVKVTTSEEVFNA